MISVGASGISFLLFMSIQAAILTPIFAENGLFKVNVNLRNTSENIGSYTIHVTIQGDQELVQSKMVDTSNQLCPGDIESLCYKSEAFLFPGDSVPVGSKIKVCVEENISHAQNCATGVNSPDNAPEVIWVDVPDVDRS